MGQLQADGIDPQQLLQPVTKACFKVSKFEEIVSTIFEAQQIAIRGKPGPVCVEIPMDLQVLHEELAQPLPIYLSAANQPETNADELDITAQKLIDAKDPALLLGWCAVDTSEKVIALADVLAAPVCTS